MKSTLTFTFITLVVFSSFSQGEIKGVWLAGEGNTKVEIYEKDSNYFGKIIWLAKPTNRKGKPHTDRMNPEKELRSRPLMGLDMLQNLTYRDGKWIGKIYSPKRGKTVDAELSLNNANELQIKGSYRGFSSVKTWTRTEAP